MKTGVVRSIEDVVRGDIITIDNVNPVVSWDGHPVNQKNCDLLYKHRNSVMRVVSAFGRHIRTEWVEVDPGIDGELIKSYFNQLWVFNEFRWVYVDHQHVLVTRHDNDYSNENTSDQQADG